MLQSTREEENTIIDIYAGCDQSSTPDRLFLTGPESDLQTTAPDRTVTDHFLTNKPDRTVTDEQKLTSTGPDRHRLVFYLPDHHRPPEKKKTNRTGPDRTVPS